MKVRNKKLKKKTRKKRVNIMSSFQQISHWNCRRYWEILSESQELSINRHCYRRNTWEAGTWCYFFIIGATHILFSSKEKLWVLSTWASSSYFFRLWRRIMFKLSLFSSLWSFMLSESCSPLNSPKSYLNTSCDGSVAHMYLKIFVLTVTQFLIKNHEDEGLNEKKSAHIEN